MGQQLDHIVAEPRISESGSARSSSSQARSAADVPQMRLFPEKVQTSCWRTSGNTGFDLSFALAQE